MLNFGNSPIIIAARDSFADQYSVNTRPGIIPAAEIFPVNALFMTDRPPEQQPRRLFLKTALALVYAPVLWLMNSLAKRAETLPENAEATLTVPLPAGNGIRFYDRAIVVAAENGVAVFSSACPHLGCRINRTEGGELVCPCHGSRFNSRGDVLRGPAARSLQPLKFDLDRAGAVLRIALKK